MLAPMPMRMVPPRTCPVAVGAVPDTTTRAASTPSTSRVLIAVLLVGHRGRSVTGSSCNMGACERVRLPRDPRRAPRADPEGPLGLRQGYCRVSLRLQPHMVNFRGYPHGSVIFALADVAFGAACNSHGEAAVALNVTIAFLDGAPVALAHCIAHRVGR